MEGTKPTEEFKVTITNMYEVFSHELGDVYDAEHRLLEDRGQRAQSASSQKLSDALQEDQEQARSRIQNIEKAFERLEEQPERKTCQATQGLISEAQAGIEEAESGPVRDLLINAATIKEELYKAAAYRNLINSVQSLEESEDVPLEGRDEIASSLQENLRQSEQAARDAEQNVPAFSDAAKKAGAFRRVRQAEDQAGEQDKGLVDKAKDKLSGQ